MRVAILTAAGEKFFCPGWDLKAAAGGDAVDGDYGVGGFGGLQQLPDLNKPVICAVNGICCGGGLEIALSCDIILAAEHATFALPEIRSGTVADAASIKLPKRIPYHVAMDLLLTGRWIDAAEARQWGLVNRIVAADKLIDEAWKMARLLESGPPLVFAAIKEIVREAEDQKFQTDAGARDQARTCRPWTGFIVPRTCGRVSRRSPRSAIRSGRAADESSRSRWVSCCAASSRRKPSPPTR